MLETCGLLTSLGYSVPKPDLIHPLKHRQELWVVKRSLSQSACPGSREIPRPFHHVGTQQEGTGYEPERMPSPECDHAGALIVDSPASRTCVRPQGEIQLPPASPGDPLKTSR
ncbi:zinc finger protein 543-like isoform X1 [Mesoplodon densirostris]|uniref:zinc finger protein 543-like isoform X1 n=1 Tax=Mesoplodon densirostris TaxID=48708 RepID=UPI0028DC4833|nr:zinc finger protein 543-like isoform X1 [Mesoplodon densirostris]